MSFKGKNTKDDGERWWLKNKSLEPHMSWFSENKMQKTREGKTRQISLKPLKRIFQP